MSRNSYSRILPLVLACAVAPVLAQSQNTNPGDERSEVEQLKAQTMALLQALVDAGLLSREKAEAIVRQASQAHAAPAAPAPASAAASAPAAPPVVHVPYISETVKAQIRHEVKDEVMAQARAEHWAQPDALPDWLSRISWEGDVRVRAEDDLFSSKNVPASVYQSFIQPTSNGGSNQGFVNPVWDPTLLNSTTPAAYFSIRARFGMNAKLSDSVTAGIRLASGPNNVPVSTSQTLGNGFNRYTINLDRAFIQVQPVDKLTVVGGRFANPFFGTDLSWPDDLNFDGLAASYKPQVNPNNSVFLTAGAFPLQEFSLGESANKWLYALQIGAHTRLDQENKFSIGLAAYDFHNMEGVQQSNYEAPLAASTDANYESSQYPSAWMQRGNTLFNIAPQTTFAGNANTGSPVWGLVTKFRPIDLNLAYDTHALQFAPLNITFDYIRNTGWNTADIMQRLGSVASNFVGLRPMVSALQLRFNLGAERIDKKGDWQAFVAWRRFDRDAWVDAYTDTTWNYGGTNYEGFSLGGRYGIAKNTSVGIRWTSTHNLEDGQSTLGSGVSNLSDNLLKINVLQIELNTRF